MSVKDTLLFICLSAIWGASFLFMRIAAPEFGAIAMVTVRAVFAAIFLLSLFIFRNKWHDMIKHWKVLSISGLTNTAIPFGLLAYASIYLNAGTTALLNSCVPIFTAIIGFLWLKKRLNLIAIVGIFFGFVGVFVIANYAHVDETQQSISWIPVLAALIATLSYGVSANFVQQYLQNIDTQTAAAGSQFYASIVLLPFGVAFWPEHEVSALSWFSGIALGILCTGIAYSIFFKLIKSIGAVNVSTVTYVIPIFSIFFGYIFLQESINKEVIIGGLLILLGISLTSGFYKRLLFKKPT